MYLSLFVFENQIYAVVMWQRKEMKNKVLQMKCFYTN